MKWLLYGSRGWIGSQVKNILLEMGEEVSDGTSRIDNYDDTFNEILAIKPDRVISTTGRTSGPGFNNIDYLEQPGKLKENLKDNLEGPINLANICKMLNVHLTYMGTGCIFEFDETHQMYPQSEDIIGFTEDDVPNFFGSQYSVVKGFTDNLMRSYDNIALNIRIRMPITNDLHPKNFITKISKYEKVISIPNSMTVLPELLPIMIDLAIREETGTINLTNPGCMTHAEVLDLYTELVDPEFTYEIMDLSELLQHVNAERSNNYLDTTKLQNMYPDVRHIKDAVRNVLTIVGSQS